MQDDSSHQASSMPGAGEAVVPANPRYLFELVHACAVAVLKLQEKAHRTDHRHDNHKDRHRAEEAVEPVSGQQEDRQHDHGIHAVTEGIPGVDAF